MQDLDKTKEELVTEVARLRQRIVALQKSKAALEHETILNTLVEHVIYEDKEMKILWANEAACASAGLSYEKLIGRHCYEIWPKRSDPCPDCPVEKAMTTGQHHEVEKMTPDGRAWIIRGYPLRDEKDNIVGGIEFTLEITEHKRAEEELQKSEEKYRELINGMNDTAWVIDFNGNFIDVNDAAVEVLGYSREELLSMGPHDIDTTLDAETITGLIKGMQKDKLQVFETTHTTKDGKIIPVEINSSLVTYQGKDAILSIARDITERKLMEQELRESEERYRSLINNVDQGINLIDANHNIIMVNDAQCKRFNKSLSEMIGEKCFRLFRQRDTVCPHCVGIQAMTTGQTAEIETERAGSDQSPSQLRVQAFPVFGEDGTATAFIQFIEDITKRKQMERDLRQSEERYRTLVENIDLGINLIDADYNIIMMNAFAASKFKKPMSELIGKKCFREFEQRDTVCPQCPGVQAMATGKPAEVETETGIGDEGQLYLRLQAFPVFGQDGTATGFIEVAENITERKQMEQKLRESEERFRKVVETMEVGLGAVDENGVLTYVNEYLAKMLGYSMDEMIGRSTLDFYYDEESRKGQEKIFAKRRAGMRDPTSYEVTWRRKDGLKVYSILSPTPSFDADGRYIGSFAIHTAITERKRMEEELRESEERFRTLFEGAPDAIFLAEPESGKILDANSAASQLLLMPHEEIIGLHHSELYPPHMGKQAKKIFIDYVQQAQRGKEVHPIESAVIRSDGSEVPVEILAQVVYIHGRPLFQGTFRNITEREQAEEALKKSEESYRLLSENIPVAVYSALPDEHSTTLVLSGQFLELTGYPREQFLENPEFWTAILHPEDREYVWGKINEHRRKKNLLEVEYRIITKDNMIKWIRDRARPVLGENGDIQRIDGFMEDITGRKQAEKALRESEEKYRSLVESSEDSIYLVDSDCIYLFMNSKYLSRLDLQSSQVIGRSYGEFHSPDETKDFVQRVENVFNIGKSISYEYRSQRDNRYFIRTLSPVESPENGKIAAITVISKDITDRKQAEEALRESERFSSSLLNDSPHPIIVINPDTSIRYTNPALETLTGFSAAELIGRKAPYPWWAKETLSKISRDLATAMRKGSQRLEEQFQKKTGERLWVEITSRPIIYDGEFQYYLANWSDITERKQAEEMLREREAFNFALFQYNPIETIVVDQDGRITGFNLAKQQSGDRLPTTGDMMYKDYAGKHEIDMRTELMQCIRLGKIKEFPERKYGDKYLSITISPFLQGALIISEDITERKRTEEALRESVQFSSSLLNDSPYPIIVINPDTSIRYVNPAMANLTGFSAEELIDRKIPYPWWPKGTERRTTSRLKKALREGNQRVERKFQKKSGERFWVEITSIPAMRNGELQYLLANWSVVTERKQAEELLQKERDTFYSILQKAPYGVMLIDKDRNHSFVNPEFTNITGYSLEDIPTGKDWLLRAYPDPQYRKMVRETWWEDFKQKEADEKFHKKFKRIFSRAFNVVCKDGTTKEIEFSRAELGDGGTLAMLADITDRKRMHELLQTAAAEWRTTFDAISDAVCLLSPQGKIIRCNNAMLKFIGKPFSEITNHYCWEVMHGVSEAPSGCPITRVAKTYQRQSEVFAKNSRWFNISVDPLLDENGALVGGVHIMSDITDRKVIEDELQGSREQLRNLTAYLESVREQERTNIAREIHDELAQALTALKMDLSWLDHRLPTDPKSLIEKTQSMNDLIDTTIQTVKRISAELRPGILDDLGLVAAIEWQTEEFHNRTGIICHVTVDPQDITVDQDRSTTIFRIFQETLTNVARHAHATRVTVSLKEKAGTLILRVRDNGRGIAEEKISDPQSFGLIGMQERVHVWGGKVSFKGIPGKGTTVTVNVRIRGDDKREVTLEKNKDV